MAVTGIRWMDEEGYDIHVLSGTTSRHLDEILMIDQDPDPPVLATHPPAGVRVEFHGEFEGAPAAHGVAIDGGTGAVTVLRPLPAGPRLYNFLVSAVVTETTEPAPNMTDIRVVGVRKIRVHTHASVTRLWLTPQGLTLRFGADGFRFTVLAEFDDGVIGDISGWAGLRWSSSDSGEIAVDADTGALRSLRRQAVATVRVEHGGLRSEAAPVSGVPAWSDPQEVAFVGGKDPAHRETVPNVLFLPDGFQASERAAFEGLVRRLVWRLRHNRSTRPFDLLPVNYWVAFVPSQDAGISLLPECNLGNSLTRTRPGVVLPQPRKPDPAATAWSLAEMIHEVGLPVFAHGRSLADLQALYGPKVTNARIQAHQADWEALGLRVLADERDTAFGLALGERPRVAQSRVPRELAFHPRRMHPEHLTEFLEQLRFRSTTIGETWTTGKDRGLVCIIGRSDVSGGTQHGSTSGVAAIGRSAAYFAVTTPGRSSDVLLEQIGGLEFRPAPARVAGELSRPFVATVGHECCHVLGLGDEYGERDGGPEYLRLPESRIGALAVSPNLQAEQDLVPPPLLHKDFERIKWLWPRIRKAGVLRRAPELAGGGFRLVLEPGHGASFRVGDVAQLRRRPLVEHPTPSRPLEITDVTGDEVRASIIGGGSLDSGGFPAGSVLFVAVRADPVGPAAFGEPLRLVAPAVLDHLRQTRGPLNAPAGNPARPCQQDNREVQIPTNLPPEFACGFPPRRASCVGLYEGGMRYHCGVYHPAGACLMRSVTGSDGQSIQPLCHVCRYVLVDRVDPSTHGVIDADYSRSPRP